MVVKLRVKQIWRIINKCFLVNFEGDLFKGPFHRFLACIEGGHLMLYTIVKYVNIASKKRQ